MSTEHVGVLVVGGGQAGLAMSAHLTKIGLSHLVLERGRVAESWRSARWDSLVANGPAWHDRFPDDEFPGIDPGAFATKDQVAEYFSSFAARIDAPVRCGVEVVSVRPREGQPGFDVQTTSGKLVAQYVVAATGPFQVPKRPAMVPQGAVATQLHSSEYKNPDQLPEGGVLVVGAGASGVQIADELRRSGRAVYLSVGRHERPARRYRGRDSAWWYGVLGMWDAEPRPGGPNHVAFAVSGARGGYTVDFRALAADGVRLVGRTESFEDGRLRFLPGLVDDLAKGDAGYLTLLDAADRYVERNGLDFPEDPETRNVGADPHLVVDEARELDLAEAGVTSIVWATGFTTDFSWLHAAAFDNTGVPAHKRGVSTEPGIYFLGLPWLSRRGSSFIWGVWQDAKFIADHIATHHGYLRLIAEHDELDGLVRAAAE